jgi:hypothetical protein
MLSRSTTRRSSADGASRGRLSRATRWLLPRALPLVGLVVVGALLAPRTHAEPRRALMDDATRAAIDRGLRFLVRTQNADGSWTCDAGKKVNNEYYVFPGAKEGPGKDAVAGGKDAHHVGVTSLAILAFLAAGHAPGRGPYGPVVDRAVGFLLSCVQRDGYIDYGQQSRMYDHAFATLAMAEVYGMSRAPELRDNLQRAVELTVKCQNDTGGWRYAPFTVDSDMSVTVCQVVALRAAKNVGLRVPQSTIDRALGYVISSAITDDGSAVEEDEVGAFMYQPASTHFNRSSFSLAAAGLTTLFQAGLYDNGALKAYVQRRGLDPSRVPSVDATVSYMRNHYRDTLAPGQAAQAGRHFFYFYGNYYAAQAMYNVGGTDPALWERWYDTVRRDLLSMEVRGRAAGPDGGGLGAIEESHWVSNVGEQHTFATSVAILILSIPFDYLPIHQR